VREEDRVQSLPPSLCQVVKVFSICWVTGHGITTAGFLRADFQLGALKQGARVWRGGRVCLWSGGIRTISISGSWEVLGCLLDAFVNYQLSSLGAKITTKQKT
jgi:hypothetical protein